MQKVMFFRYVRDIYAGLTVWLPALLVGVALLLVMRRRRAVAVVLLISAGVLVGLRVWATDIEPHRLKVIRVAIPTAKVDRPLRILHITDIQSPALGAYEARAFEVMRGLTPDLVLNTGDNLQPQRPATYASEAPKLEALFASLDPPLGKWGVIGNIDGRHRDTFGPAPFGGMVTLVTSDTVVHRGRTTIRIHGLDLRESGAGTLTRREVGRWLEVADPDEVTILMGHRPDYISVVDDLPIDLCLAGHTHGGQVRLPVIGPIVTFADIPKELARGMHRVGRTRLNVSSGIGSEHVFGLPSIRLNSPPDMTLIELVPE
jgi:hypothetical protein